MTRPPTTSSTRRPRPRPWMIQQKLTPTQKRRKFLLGDVYLGLQNATSGQRCRTGTTTARSARSTFTSGPPRLEVPDARARARRRHRDGERPSALPAAATASCVRSPLKTGKILWTFQTAGARSRPRPDGVQRRRQGVRRGDRRRHADLVERRPGLAAPGVRGQRLPRTRPALRRTPSPARRWRASTSRRRRSPAVRRDDRPQRAPRSSRASPIDGGPDRPKALAGGELERGNGPRRRARLPEPGRPVGARVAVDRFTVPARDRREGRVRR